MPAVVRHCPRAATHLRAAAIRLNVAIWTNMDPSEGGQKSSQHNCTEFTPAGALIRLKMDG